MLKSQFNGSGPAGKADPGCKRLASKAWPTKSLAIGWIVSERQMKFNHVVGFLCAAAVSLALAGQACAQDKTVKIGAVFPLSGNAASAGNHAKAALEVAMDIINNAHPELGNL